MNLNAISLVWYVLSSDVKDKTARLDTQHYDDQKGSLFEVIHVTPQGHTSVRVYSQKIK